LHHVFDISLVLTGPRDAADPLLWRRIRISEALSPQDNSASKTPAPWLFHPIRVPMFSDLNHCFRSKVSIVLF
jgi:hypothetical protein